MTMTTLMLLLGNKPFGCKPETQAEQEAAPIGNVAHVQLGLGVQHRMRGALRYSLPPRMSLQELQAKGNACKNFNIF